MVANAGRRFYMIGEYLDHHNADPKPFVWTKNALEQLASGN
jgi:hypothetical protein